MTQDIKSLKTEIVSALEVLSPESLKLLAEFAQFLRLKGNATPQNAKIDTSSSPAADGAWTLLESLTGTIQAPPDWSSEHDHYLYGTPKRQSEDNI